jgi:hypothetical protein
MTIERPMFPPHADNVVVAFPSKQRPRRDRKPYENRGANMQTFLFRSYDLILESDEADLLRDVRLDIDKAAKKVEKIRGRLRDIKEQSAATDRDADGCRDQA